MLRAIAPQPPARFRRYRSRYDCGARRLHAEGTSRPTHFFQAGGGVRSASASSSFLLATVIELGARSLRQAYRFAQGVVDARLPASPTRAEVLNQVRIKTDR